jgi:hypoxanthine phosphoribosyltransferase
MFFPKDARLDRPDKAMPIPLKKKKLFSQREIQKRVRELAQDISVAYQKQDLVLIGVLKGAFMFMSDLAKCLSIPVMMDFVRLASYGSQSQSKGEICLTKGLELPIKGKNVLVIEDIVDSGLTLQFLMEYLKKEEPKSIRTCALIDKSERRAVPVFLDYIGFSIPKGFVVGYGLDFDEHYRHLPALYHLPLGGPLDRSM